MVGLAVWKTTVDAYRFVFTEPVTVIRTGWVFFGVDLLDLIEKLRYGGPVPLYASAPVVVALSVAFASWQIAFSRAILLNENSSIAAINLGRRFWRLVGAIALSTLIFMGVVAILAFVAVLVATTLGVEPHLFGKVLAVVMVVLIALVLPRLYLFGPSIATDDDQKAIRAAWRRGQHNTLRLVFGSVICWLPSFIVTAVFYMTIGLPGTAAARINVIAVVLYLVWTIINFFGTAVWVAFEAFAYRQLALNWNPPPALAASQIET